jgi:sugar O-acyltransferase (sialic acid O-acetyltransferase NeuD family)
MLKPLAIYGASWHGREVLQVALDTNVYVGQGCFLDDNAASGEVRNLDGLPVLPGTFLNDQSFIASHRFIVTIGDNAIRLRIGRHILNLGGEVISVIHPTALVWHEAEIGDGSVIFPFAIVSVAAKIGQFCIVNKHATVGHGAVMEDGSNVADSTAFSGRLGTGSFMGLHAVAIPGVDIGARSTVGAGAVCIRSVPDDTTATGVPARAK